MESRKWISRLFTAVLSVILVAALGVILATDMLDEYSQPEPKEDVYDPSSALVMQKSNLIKQQDQVKQEYLKRIRGMGTVTILFTQPDAVFMELVVPMMEQNEIVGVVAFGPDRYPGQEGCISIEEWRSLEEGGWETCLMWDGSARISEWVPEMNKRLVEVGMEPSFSVYVPENLFEEELLVEARRMNLKALVHQSKELEEHNDIRINDVWLPKGLAWHLDNTSEQVDKVVSEGGSIVLEVQNEIIWDGGYRRLFQSMLEKLLGWQEENKMRIDTINRSISYRQGVLMDSMEMEKEMHSQLEMLSLQIEKINAQIDEIRQSGQEIFID